MPRRTASRSTQSSYGLSEWASFGTVGQLAGFRERLFGAGVPIVKGGLVFPLTYHGGDLFWRSHILQQLADVGRAQGILTVAIEHRYLRPGIAFRSKSFMGSWHFGQIGFSR